MAAFSKMAAIYLARIRVLKHMLVNSARSKMTSSRRYDEYDGSKAAFVQ